MENNHPQGPPGLPPRDGGPTVTISLTGYAVLPRRQIWALAAVMMGYQNAEIAEHLGVSIKTIENYRSKLLRALGARHIQQAATIAVARGLVVVHAMEVGHA